MHSNIFFWILFSIIILFLFAIDIYVTDRRQGKISIKTSLMWSSVWVSAALVFDLFIYFFLDNGHVKALEFLTGYLIEESLSVDNLFVFFLIFGFMKIKGENQPHILMWGILSAIVMRMFAILFGVTLLHLFHPIIYLFGAILFFAAFKMAFGKDSPIDLESNPLVKFVSKRFNVLTDYTGKHFFKKNNGRLFLTPLFLTLLMIESADIVFALDSIPAVIAITPDPFIIITSNIFAIVGLRSLYFALAGMAELFGYLKYGVAVILTFVGLKMMTSDLIQIPTSISLAIICISLIVSIIVSLIFNSKSKKNKNKLTA